MPIERHNFNRVRILSSKAVMAKSGIVLFVVSEFRQWKPSPAVSEI